MNKYKFSNKDLSIFFIVTFGLTAIMGFAMAFTYPSKLVESFPVMQMLLPALGAMIALLLNKEKRALRPKKFFGVYIILAIIFIAYTIIQVSIFQKSPATYLNYAVFIGCLILFVAYNLDSKESIECFGLKASTNIKKSIINIVLFVFLYMFAAFISSLLMGEIEEFITPLMSPRPWYYFLNLPLSFIMSFIPFIGEEYGWRYFLQTALQERLGKRKGVILLGLIWGIWHLPINMFYYSPQTPTYSVINQLIVCTCYSIFFGYVYMKTNNIWAISIIHYINNSLGYVLYGAMPDDVVFTWKALVLNLVILVMIYVPFIFAKEYKEDGPGQVVKEEDI